MHFILDSLLSEFILGKSSSEELLFPSDTSYTIFIGTGKIPRISLGKIILLGNMTAISIALPSAEQNYVTLVCVDH